MLAQLANSSPTGIFSYPATCWRSSSSLMSRLSATSSSSETDADVVSACAWASVPGSSETEIFVFDI